MISRKLNRRLEELESRLAPAAEPLIVEIQYVSADGSREAGPRFEVPMPAVRRPRPRRLTR